MEFSSLPMKYTKETGYVINKAYDGFKYLLNIIRGPSETLKNFERKFSASVTNFNALFKTKKIPQYINTLMLLRNYGIEQSQPVLVLSAANPSSDMFIEQSSNEEFISAVTYKQIASVVK